MPWKKGDPRNPGFKKGQSGNPGGRPAIIRDVKELARARTVEAVDALVAALANPGERVTAAMGLLAYGYGRPVQNMNLRRIGSFEDLTDEEIAALAEITPKGTSDATRH